MEAVARRRVLALAAFVIALDDLDELRAAAHARLEELFADALPGEESASPDAGLCTTNINIRRTQKRPDAQPPKTKSDAPLFSATPQSLPENRNFSTSHIHKNVTSRTHAPPPGDVPGETQMREHIAVMVESGALDEEAARDFEALAHDPLTREVFARRYMRGSPVQGGIT